MTELVIQFGSRELLDLKQERPALKLAYGEMQYAIK